MLLIPSKLTMLDIDGGVRQENSNKWRAEASHDLKHPLYLY